MKLFNIDLHISVIADVKNIFEHECASLQYNGDDIKVIDKSISGHQWVMDRDDTAPDIISAETWRNIDDEMCNRFYDRYKEELSEYDGFIVTHTPVLCRLYLRFNKPIIIVNSCRYHQPFQGNKSGWLQFDETIGENSKQLVWVSNNKADQAYLQIGAGVSSVHIPSLCLYTHASYTGRNPLWLLYGTHAISEISGVLERMEKHLPHGYKWSELYDFKGVVCMPYDASTMTMFELYSANVPLFFPTKRLFLELLNSGKAYLNSRYGSALGHDELRDTAHHPDTWQEWWLDHADYYDSENMPYIQYFDCISELPSLLHDVDTDAISLAMRAHNVTRKELAISAWGTVLGKVQLLQETATHNNGNGSSRNYNRKILYIPPVSTQHNPVRTIVGLLPPECIGDDCFRIVRLFIREWSAVFPHCSVRVVSATLRCKEEIALRDDNLAYYIWVRQLSDDKRNWRWQDGGTDDDSQTDHTPDATVISMCVCTLPASPDALCGVPTGGSSHIQCPRGEACLLHSSVTLSYDNKNEFPTVVAESNSAHLLCAIDKSNCVKIENDSAAAPSVVYGMRVVFALWGDSEVYNYGALENALLMQELYPWARARFYIQTQTTLPHITEALRSLPNVDVIERPGKNMSSAHMMWRFEDAFCHKGPVLVRDVDSIVSRREQSAVWEWLSSPHNYHIMRDCPQHDMPMMGGMWGVRNGAMCHLLAEFQAYPRPDEYNLDQRFLSEFVYPEAEKSYVVHASYHGRESGARQFPVAAAQNGDFVGNFINTAPLAFKFLKESNRRLHTRRRNVCEFLAVTTKCATSVDENTVQDEQAPVRGGSPYHYSSSLVRNVIANKDKEAISGDPISRIQTIVDIGCGTGVSLLKLASTYSSAARIIGFDAYAEQIRACRVRLDQAPPELSARVSVHVAGLGKCQSLQEFFPYNASNRDASSFMKRIDFEQCQHTLPDLVHIDTLSARLSEIFEDKGVTQQPIIDLLCISVQGYELCVLEGSPLARVRWLIMCVPRKIPNPAYLPPGYHSKYIGAPSRQQVVAYLFEKGFHVHLVMYENELEDYVIFHKSTIT